MTDGLRFLLISSFFLLLLMPAACQETTSEQGRVAATPKAEARDEVRVHPSLVEEGRIVVEPVEQSALPRSIEVTGRIGVNENRTVRIGSIVEGRINRVLANVGDQVREGARLAYLHSPEVHEARARYAQAVADLASTQTELEYALSARDRAKRLLELRAGSLQELQRAEADYKHAEKATTIAQAEIGRLEERLRHLGLSAEGASDEYGKPRRQQPGQFEENELVPIVSPLAGTVLERFVTPGVVVSPATDLFVISDLNTLWIHADVPEKYLAPLAKGHPVTLTVQAYPKETFSARIIHIGDVLNPETRTVRVLCLTENADRRLKAEMYAVVQFELPAQHSSLVIPLEAVQSMDGQDVVFVRESDTLFHLRSVETGRQLDSKVEVVSGVNEGEEVVSRGSFLLKSELLKSRYDQE